MFTLNWPHDGARESDGNRFVQAGSNICLESLNPPPAVVLLSAPNERRSRGCFHFSPVDPFTRSRVLIFISGLRFTWRLGGYLNVMNIAEVHTLASST